MKAGLLDLKQRFPNLIHEVRGLGLMIGVELAPDLAKLPGDPAKAQASRFANLLHAGGLLIIPAGTNIFRLLPALNLSRAEAEAGLAIIEAVLKRL